MSHLVRSQIPVPHRRDDTALITRGVSITEPNHLEGLRNSFEGHDLAHLLVFASHKAQFAQTLRRLSGSFVCPVVGCTSAGQIGPGGYLDDHIVAVGLPRRLFAACTVVIDDVSDSALRAQVDSLIQQRMALKSTNPDKPNGFCFLMSNGSGDRRDALARTLKAFARDMPLVGGTIDHGLGDQPTHFGTEGRVYDSGALVTFVVTACEALVFATHHMAATDRRMVVTEADPATCTVQSINAEPAAAEYARLVGIAPGNLDPLTFAAHPVAVRQGTHERLHVVRQVTDAGYLVFHSPIEAGSVLSAPQAQDMAEHLDGEMTTMINGFPKPSILACEAASRRIEARLSQGEGAVSAVLGKHGIVGLSTYGEVADGQVVDHTLNGVALFPPGTDLGR